MEVCGELTALSHIFKSSPVCFLLELSNDRGRHIVTFTEKKLFHWHKKFRIGTCYTLRGLTRVTCKIQGKSVRMFKVQISSEVNAREDLKLPNIPSIAHTVSGAVVHGIISEINTFVGLVTLNQTDQVFISYELLHSEFPCLYKGQMVTFYNIHNYCDNVFVMCSRGLVVTHCQGKGEKSISGTDHPLVALSIKKSIGFQDLLWFHVETENICEAFPIIFLQKWFESKERATKVRLKTMTKLLERNIRPDSVPLVRSLVNEFSQADNHACLPMKKSQLLNHTHSASPLDILNYAQTLLNDALQSREGNSERDLGKKQYSQPLVGVLTPDAEGIFFHLKDSHCYIIVMVRDEDRWLIKSGELSSLNNCMVVISNCLLVNHVYRQDCASNVNTLRSFHIEVNLQDMLKI